MNYVLDDNNNKIPAYSKEEVLAVINKAIADGTLADIVADAAFISQIKCCVSGDTHLFAFVTQAKYNELKENNQLVNNCYYIIIDDTTADDLDEQLETINNSISETKAALNDVITRVDALGFKEGAFGFSGSAQTNSIKKQGNYVIANLKYDGSDYVTLTVPEEFRPKEDIEISASGLLSSAGLTDANYRIAKAYITTDGIITFHSLHDMQSSDTAYGYLELNNVGWEIENSTTTGTTTSNCTDCNGTGQIYINGLQAPCPTCDGSGRVNS